MLHASIHGADGGAVELEQEFLVNFLEIEIKSVDCACMIDQLVRDLGKTVFFFYQFVAVDDGPARERGGPAEFLRDRSTFMFSNC